jgi:hypothetical protein
VVGLSWGLWIDRLRESWVKELQEWQLVGWVQQQSCDSAWRVGDGQGRL